MNDHWAPEFVCDRDITNKAFSIKDFAVFMNFSHDKKDVLFDEITKDWNETDQDKKYM
jgi:hypothetical protein